MLDYILPLVVCCLAVFGLIKDWDAYKTSPRRLAVLLLILGVGVGTAVKNVASNRAATQQHQSDQRQIAALQKAVEDNTKQFVAEFGRMSQKVSDLQAQVKTESLRTQAAQLKAELEATQKALNLPKAALTFSFAPHNPDTPPISTISLTTKDNVVHVEFTVVNTTDVAALDGELTLWICRSCQFASEPAHFRKLEGADETSRVLVFDRLLAMSEAENMSVDIRVPVGSHVTKLAMTYRCRNCIVAGPHDNEGTVILQ